MYLSRTFKLRHAELHDFFVCHSFPKNGVRFLKERVLYFLFINGSVYGPYKTYYNCTDIGANIEMRQLIYEQKALVIEPRQVAQEVTSEKLYMRKAVYDDMERNTLYFEYTNKQLFGPYSMETDISEFDTKLISKLNNGLIFIINEKQMMKR